jgi:tetratricopeptide (TPR) repeat protein
LPLSISARLPVDLAFGLSSPACAKSSEPHGCGRFACNGQTRRETRQKTDGVGRTAGKVGAYEQALANYDEAIRYSPFDVTLVGKAAALRSKLVQGYVDNAEKLTVQGHFLEASEQIAAALRIDPTNETLLERLKQVDSMHEATKGTSPEEPAEGLPQLAPEKGQKSFRLQTDLHSAYQQVAAAFGLKATFDPDLPARNVKLRLENVDFDTAMKVLTAETFGSRCCSHA